MPYWTTFAGDIGGELGPITMSTTITVIVTAILYFGVFVATRHYSNSCVFMYDLILLQI